MSVMTNLRAAAAATFLVTTLVACTNDSTPNETSSTRTSAATSAPASSAPPIDPACRLSAEELSDITGVEQTIEVSDFSGDAVACEAPEDSRGIDTTWYLITPPGGVVASHRKQGSDLRKIGYNVAEVDLGSGTKGWVGTGPLDIPNALLLARVDGKELHVLVVGPGNEASLQDDVADYATGVARAFVANGQG